MRYGQLHCTFSFRRSTSIYVFLSTFAFLTVISSTFSSSIFSFFFDHLLFDIFIFCLFRQSEQNVWLRTHDNECEWIRIGELLFPLGKHMLSMNWWEELVMIWRRVCTFMIISSKSSSRDGTSLFLFRMNVWIFISVSPELCMSEASHMEWRYRIIGEYFQWSLPRSTVSVIIAISVRSLVEIRVISFQVQGWIWKGSCKELLFFPEEMKSSWKKRVTGKFPGSWQDLKQDVALKIRCYPFRLNQDPDQEVPKSWKKRVTGKSSGTWQDW